MKTKFNYLAYLVMLISTTITAQNVSISATGVAPSGDAGLDVNFTNKGLLIPRVSLTNTGTYGLTGGGPTTSMLVYNTNAGIAGTGAMGAGYYYWNGTRWAKLLVNNSPSDAWLITGNAGTTAGTHFVGTTDAQALDFRTNNTIRFRIANGNQVFAMADGTAGAPFYSWNSDPDIGMYRIGADQIGISTGGVYRMTIGAYNGSIGGSNRIPCCGRAGSGPIVDFYMPMEVGNDGGSNSQASLGYWRGADVEVSPEQNMNGYVGYPASPAFRNAWWGMATYNFTNYSGRDEKKNIIPINDNENIEALVMQDIEKMKPSFYNFKVENESPVSEHDMRYRKHFHVGVIVDESPDYIKDASLSGIDVYGIGTLALTGVKANMKKIQKLEKQINSISVTISDFGTAAYTGGEMWVNYNNSFKEKLKGKTPVVFITPISKNSVNYRVLEKNSNGFKIIFEGTNISEINFDWMATVKVENEYNSNDNNKPQVDAGILGKMYLTEEEKQKAINNYNIPPSPVATPIKSQKK